LRIVKNFVRASASNIGGERALEIAGIDARSIPHFSNQNPRAINARAKIYSTGF
jgi:hypothetical protein